MHDIIAVKAYEAVSLAVGGVVDLAVHHHQGVGNTAVALSVGVVEAAGVDAGHGVKLLDHFLNGIAPDAEALRDAAHNDP